METRLLIASVACKLLIYGHLCVTLARQINSAISQAPGFMLRALLVLIQSSLISRVPDNLNCTGRHLRYVFIVYLRGAFSEFIAVSRIEYKVPAKQRDCDIKCYLLSLGELFYAWRISAIMMI